MPTPKHLRATALALALVVPTLAAHAALTTYTTAASFAAATTAGATDTFDDILIDALPTPQTRSAGSYGYTVSTSGSLFGAGSEADKWLSTQNSGSPLQFGTFIGGIQAVGGLFFGTDQFFAFQPGQTLTLTAVDSLGASASFDLVGATTTSFVGFRSTGTITSLTATIANGESYATANDLVLAKAPPTPPVPEPATVGMLLAGLGLLGVARRRPGR